MKYLKKMIESTPTKKEAIVMLNIWRSFNHISEADYKKGRTLINIEFD